MNNHKPFEYNILLYGAPGAGKSTIVNAMTNYLTLSNSSPVLSENLANNMTSKFSDISMSVHAKTTEDQVDYSSAPQFKSYKLMYNNKTVNLIDTHSDAYESGNPNFKKILECLHSYETLHAICFVIKANTGQNKSSVDSYFKELLIHLSRRACKNIMFCFTSNQNSPFSTAEGFVALKELLDTNEFEGEKIELILNNNCFYIDSEWYQHLGNNCSGDSSVVQNEQSNHHCASHSKSVEQLGKMLQQITSLSPYEVKQTFQLIKARKLIPEMAASISEMKKKINEIQSKINVHSRTQLIDRADVNLNSTSTTKSIELYDNLKREYEAELGRVRDYTFDLVCYLIENSNVIDEIRDLKLKCLF